MEIIVCLKRVPDTGEKIEIQKGGLEIKEESLPWILNPYDEFAVEEAIRIKERFGGRVTLLTVGAEGGEEILRRGIAMGADETVYIKDAALKSLNGLGIVMALSKIISTISFDLILCGKQGTDEDYGMVGGAIAGLLDIPVVSAIKKLNILQNKRRTEVYREVEGGMEVLECPLPALFTTQKGLNEPRYPSLPGIIKAKKQKIRYLDLSSLKIKREGLQTLVKRERLSYSFSERKGVILDKEVRDAVKEITRFLKEEVKVI